MTITTEEAEAKCQELLDHCHGQRAKVRWPHRVLHDAVATIRSLAAERDRLRDAFRAEREENLWNAFNIGSIRIDKWIDCRLSDAEWLVREIGLDQDATGYDPEEIKRRIPEAAARAALEGGEAKPDKLRDAVTAVIIAYEHDIAQGVEPSEDRRRVIAVLRAALEGGNHADQQT